MAVVGSEPIFQIVKTNTLPTGNEIRSYVELQRQIHDALRVEHPEWVKPNGDCPTCESYESRLAELLGLSSPKLNRPVA
jgi:hypothetical protein